MLFSSSLLSLVTTCNLSFFFFSLFYCSTGARAAPDGVCRRRGVGRGDGAARALHIGGLAVRYAL